MQNLEVFSKVAITIGTGGIKNLQYPTFSELGMYFTMLSDFGSALHNAMRMKGNKRLLGTLTGAIAEAMYGCRNYFIKKKYADENHCVNDICIPLKINERYHRTISKIK